MSISPENYAFVCQLLKKHSAIALNQDKHYLVLSRLLPMAKQAKLDSVDALIDDLRLKPNAGRIQQLVDAMSTNETSFFRDSAPFDLLADRILPEIVQRRKSMRTLNIWSAGCSSGQEPFSVAMLWCEHFAKLADWRLNVLATDISTEMLSRGQAGRFSNIEVSRGLPEPYLAKYFRENDDHWLIDKRLQAMVKFRALNLSASWPALPQMDVVLLRNVLVYFDVATKKEILRKVRGVLRPDGYLFLGGTETTLTIDDQFERVATPVGSYYRLKGSEQLAGQG